jgi:hypothetical protein
MWVARLIVFLLLYSLQNQTAKAQNNTVLQDSLIKFYKELKKAYDDPLKENLNSKIYSLLKDTLSQQYSYTVPFDSVNSLGVVNSPDNSFRLLTWFYPLSDGTYRYYGFIQAKGKNDSIKLFDLNDKFHEIDNPENIVLSADKWMGCIYYKIIKNKVAYKTYYTLLALRYNNLFTTAKLIDILYFDEYGNPVFGAPLLKTDKKIKHRALFQYSARVVMNLKYDEDLKMIIFDHLAPSESKYSGQFEYYGPDFTFDGFEFKNDYWIYKPNLDLRRKEATVKRSPKTSNKLR